MRNVALTTNCNVFIMVLVNFDNPAVKPATRIEVVEIVTRVILHGCIFLASTDALYEHDDTAHNDVHTAGHEAIQSIRISVQRTGTVPPYFHVRYVVLVMNVAFY